MLTPYIPYPPSSGGQVRSINLLKFLSKNHDIHLVSLIKNDKEAKYADELKKYCSKVYTCKRSESPWTFKNVSKSIFGKYPFLVNRNYSSEAEKLVKDLLQSENFDLIHAETFYIMPHIPDTEIPIFLVEQTIEYRVFQHFVKNQVKVPFFRPFFWPDIFKLRYWEKTFWKKADFVGAVSEADKAEMLKLAPDLEVAIIPNAAGEDLLNIYSKRPKKPKPIFLFNGNYSWLQNVEGAKILINKIFPYIKQRIPDAECIISGQRAIEKLGATHHDGIRIVDIASSDVQQLIDVYTEGNVFLSPLEGPGGTRLKILGAMAAGMPVISSKTGVGGLDVTHNENCFIASTPKEYADYAIRLLDDEDEYHRIQKNARKLVDDVYSWASVSKTLEKLYHKLKNKS